MAKNDQAKETCQQFSEVLLQYARPLIPEGEKLSGDSRRTGSKSSESRSRGPRGADASWSISNSEATVKAGREASDFIDIAKRILNLFHEVFYSIKDIPIEGKPSDVHLCRLIGIELADFRESGSKRLLNDLLFDSARDGVALDQSRHGKGQPEALKRMLRSHGKSGLKKIAMHIHKKKNTAVLDYPTNKIRFKT